MCSLTQRLLPGDPQTSQQAMQDWLLITISWHLFYELRLEMRRVCGDTP